MSRQPLTALVLLLTMSSMTVAAEGIDYARDVRPILERHCYACHAGDEQEGGLRLDIHGRVLRGGDAYGPSIVPGQPDESPLIQFISREDADLAMPPDGERLSAEEVATLSRWIELGADWPAGLDPVEDDGRDHWSFQPLVDTPLPEVLDDAWPRGDLDRFVLARLEQAGLYPAPEADSVTWLRRVSLDLTGLPPTPEQVESFLADTSGDACERVVDELLASPRYGERWAQHWLDVVRYADTHGFEVNTERPHAWPYRDYVIEALNADTPYDQFIREQIVGDSRGKDAATGFLVTASVLLPGQIGKDEPSKRLARQDSLDEIVVNIGQTFLGLTVGCARCHHHKFDPISQHDYYAMQAFVAGVEYGDREWRTPATEARQRESESLREQIAKIDQKLAHFVPLARLDDGPPQTTSPQLNSEQFDPIPAKFVRFTIHDANRHPSLGLIEPCLDEFEIFEAPPSTSANGVTSDARNVALASHGTKVTASGSNTSDRHKLEHINDGQYGNSRSWMADQRGQGWVLFELPEPTLISRVDWSRDRNGKFTDRLATAYTLEAGESVDAMTRLAHVPPARPAVNSRHNTDRFAPTTTRRLRFTILATSSLEPCLDEIEILNRDGVNVALATHGSTVRSSGNYDSPGVHELRFVHDGEYGNSRSWISSEIGGGWVEIEFPQDETIDRVIWGRDRDGKFTDRLPTEYRIEVWNTEGDWESVAASTDRAPFDSDVNADMEPSFAALPEDEAQEATRLQADRQRLERRLEVASQAMQVFAGTFRSPDEIHVLRRGDPEQPQDRVNPAVPELLGTLSLPTDAPEQLRRTALADWIADPHHPLTTRVMVNRLWQG
ncbi:MAG: DUF1549 domain-containing protein, partial [Planctomycetaceae bacterium]|nr:DUF1549 domain-containing protein [Planctomycetaceae bacterium]